MMCEVTEISMPVATMQQQTAAPGPDEEQLPVWSTPRPSSSGETVTRSFAQVVSGIPSIPQPQGAQPPSASPPTPPASASDEEKDLIIRKLREEVAALSKQLEQQQQQEQQQQEQQQREQQQQQQQEVGSLREELGGGDNLLSMLRADLETTGTEREAVQRANDRLLQLLSDAVKTYLAVEDSINRRLARIVTQGSRATSAPHSGGSSSADPPSHSPPGEGPQNQDAERLTPTPQSEGAEGGGSQDTTLEETSFQSVATDEGLDVSQRLVEGLFLGPDLDAEGEELVQDARDRLQRVVNQLLDGMERTTQQLMEARNYQEELLASLETAHQDLQAERARAEEGEDRLRYEVSGKEYFAQELHKAEGLISGYTAEREEMEGRLQRLEEEREVMAGDLERTLSKLADFEADQQSLEAQRQALQRQQTLLQQNVGGAENQALLGELSKMTEDKRQLQQQLRHQAQRNQASLRELESLSEEQQQRMEKELEAQRAEIADLKLQLDNTERQLKAKKQFIDEQSAEREQEREEYQREMDRMKEVVTNLDRRGSAQGRLQQEVADLTEQLESRISSHSEMLQRTEQMQRDLQDKELTAEELKQMVGQLERELEEKVDREDHLQQRIRRLEEQVKGDGSQSETSETGASSPVREQRGSPRMLSPDRHSLPRNVLSLQEELLRAQHQEEELQREKELLQQQVQEQMLQISALRNQLDDLKHWGTDPVTSSSHLADLRQQLQSLRDQLEKREQEVGVLEEEKEKLEEKLSQQEAETDTLREAVKSGNFTEPGQVENLTQERDRLQHEVATLREQLAEREKQATESHSQQSSLSGDYSLTERDPAGLLSASLTQRTNFQQELQQTVAEKESALAAAEAELESSQQQVAQLQAQLTLQQSQLSKLQEDGDARLELMSEKETAVEQLQEQVESLQQEISSLTTHQNELQKDFDEVQTMLEEKEREMEALSRELADSRLSAEAPDPELVLKLEREILALKKELQEKINVINEKEEEMYVINEKLEQQDGALEQLKTTQEERDSIQAKLQEATQQLAQMKEQQEQLKEQQEQMKEQQAGRSTEPEEEQDGALQMELYATQEEKRLLEEELEEKEKLLGVKEAELEELRSRVKGEEEAKEQPLEEAEETEVRVEVLEKRLEEREREISTLKSQLESSKSAASSGRAQDDVGIQEVEVLRSRLREAQDTIGRLQASGRAEWAWGEEREGLEAGDAPSLQQQLHQCQEELELFRTSASLSAADFVKKVMELRRELSAAHQDQIRDVQTRFADEEEARLSMLQQRHQLELDQQQKVWERRLAAAVNQERQTLEQQHGAHLAELRQLHQREIDTLLQSRTAFSEDEGAALAARLQAKVRDTEGWLDSRLLHHLGQQQEGEAPGADSMDVASVSDLSSSVDVTSDETVSSRLQALLDRLHRQGLNLLTLSELQFLKQHLSPEQQQATPALGDSPAVLAAAEAWQRERQTLVSTIAALKELLSQAHRAAAPGVTGEEEEGETVGRDWRGELLTALCNVFGSEREKLLAELRSFLSSQSADSQSALETLEKRVQDQEDTHRQALQQLLSADRQSLLEEVRVLRSGQSVGQQHQQQELLQLQEKLAEVEKKEWQLQRKVQVLEYKLQQKEVIEEDLQASLAAEQERLGVEREQLAREREHSLQLQTELNSLQLDTSQLKDALERDRLRFATFSDELEEMRAERARLLELLEQQKQKQQPAAAEGKSVPDSSSALRHSQQEANTHFIKELSAELERERAHSSDLAHQLEVQSSRYTSLEQELEAQMRQAKLASTELSNQVSQLQQSLHSESERTSELARALERERQLRQSQEQAEPERPDQEEPSAAAAAAAELRSRLAAEQALVSDLQTALEREQRLRASSQQQQQEERAAARQAQEEERLTSRHLATQLEMLQGAEKGEEAEDLRQHLALSRRHLESILQRLEHVTVQLQQLPQSQREHAVPDTAVSSSSQLQQQLDNILSEVRQLQPLLTGQEGDRGAEPVLVSFINERVLQHNAELNTYIAVLCREKEELRTSNTLLQQQLEAARTTRQRLQQVESEGSSSEAEEEWLRQRALWASEKLTLQMALDSAEREVEHLQVELRRIREQLDSEGLFANPKRDKMNKLYGKYLRAESYRRALVYQKRYLLQLLGGYEDCERETLDIIAAMGAHPTVRDVQLRQQFSRPLNRFRAAAYTSIAVYRLRYLVKKWRRATRVGSPVITGCLDVNTGYMPTAGSFSPPTSPPRTARSQPPGPPPRSALAAYHPSAQRHSSPLQSRQMPSHGAGVGSSSSGAYSLLPLGQEDLTQETLMGNRSFHSLATSSGGAPFSHQGAPFSHQQAQAAGHYQSSSASRALGGAGVGRADVGRPEASYGLDQARLRTYSSASAAVASGQHRLSRHQANGSSGTGSSSLSSGGLRYSGHDRSSPRDLRSPAAGSSRRRNLQDLDGNGRVSSRSRDSQNDEFIQRLENLQHRLSGYSPRDHSRPKQRHTLSLQ